MVIKILSDLHLEFHPDGGHGLLSKLELGGADLVVVAGDFCVAAKLEEMLPVLWKGAGGKLLFVPGNHEYYGSSFGAVEKVLRRVERGCPGLHVLLEESRVIGGRTFFGGTLWFPFLEGARKFEGAILDFARIRDFRREVYGRYQAMRRLLEERLKPGDVVVSHHLPSPRSVAARYQGSPYNAFFASDLDALILERRPALWVHGHTHDSCDYRLGGTRVLCNPYGYHESEMNPGFSNPKAVEI